MSRLSEHLSVRWCEVQLSAGQAEEEGGPDAKAKELLKMERMGLTPDWIIQVTYMHLSH